MWMELSTDGEEQPSQCVLFHMGMTGSLVFRHKPLPQYKSFEISKTWPPKFCKAQFIFEGDVVLAYTDPRRWGRIQVRRQATRANALAAMGRH